MNTQVPVVIPPDAAALAAELGMQAEMEQMFEWVRKNVPRLQAIRVELWHPRRAPARGPHLVIWAHQHPTADPTEEPLVEWEWDGWKAQTFPPRVCRRFIMNRAYRPLDLAC
jgi:hypothetical protein